MAGDKEHHAARIEFHKKRIKDMADAFDRARDSDAQDSAKDKSFEIGAEVLASIESMAIATIKAAAHAESLAKLSEAILEEMKKMTKPVEVTLVAEDSPKQGEAIGHYLTRRANPNCKVCDGTGMVRTAPGSLFSIQSCPACIDNEMRLP